MRRGFSNGGLAAVPGGVSLPGAICFLSAFIRVICVIRVERFFGSGDQAEAGRMGFGKAVFLTQIKQIARIKPGFQSAFIRQIRQIRVEKLRLS